MFNHKVGKELIVSGGPYSSGRVLSAKGSSLVNSAIYKKCKIANAAARVLARHAKNVSHEIIWMEESPLPAIEALYMDSTFI